MNKEGFWYSKYEPHFPNPISNILTEKQAIEIYTKIHKLEEISNKIRYKGFSKSRITGERLDCIEYVTPDKKWCFPGDFSKHYVLQHKVKPSDNFLKYIGYD